MDSEPDAPDLWENLVDWLWECGGVDAFADVILRRQKHANRSDPTVRKNMRRNIERSLEDGYLRATWWHDAVEFGGRSRPPAKHWFNFNGMATRTPRRRSEVKRALSRKDDSAASEQSGAAA